WDVLDDEAEVLQPTLAVDGPLLLVAIHLAPLAAAGVPKASGQQRQVDVSISNEAGPAVGLAALDGGAHLAEAEHLADEVRLVVAPVREAGRQVSDAREAPGSTGDAEIVRRDAERQAVGAVDPVLPMVQIAFLPG